MDLLNPTQMQLDVVTSIREKNRASKLFNHLATVGEGISALGWVAMDAAEASKQVGEMRDASQFYANRIVREYKEGYAWSERKVDDSGDTSHKEWQSTFIEILNELQKYVRKHFPQGIKWNPEGVPADTFIGTTTAPGQLAPPASALVPSGTSPTSPLSPISAISRGLPLIPSSGPPPPPPPPAPAPETLVAAKDSTAPTEKASMGAVFSQINQGEGIASGLKHVDNSEMTHKNTSLKDKKANPYRPRKPSNLQHDITPFSQATINHRGRKSLEGVKWVIVVSDLTYLMIGKLLRWDSADLYRRDRDRDYSLRADFRHKEVYSTN
jgi:adenylyl cyclase-associated protein